eukprot:TRINITY_DN988_c0_g1_i1.p1 TRINITY_DN988_c0_g1~~TRINITY_DN988_c0_g1_i1.p1  ORF type:complete len:210 (-),score=51.55 TRINITY_DN988_c0_g1_i1:51-680(-)
MTNGQNSQTSTDSSTERMKKCREMTQESLRVLHETKATGQETCIKLEQQSTQIVNCQHNVDLINDQLHTGDRLLRSISSIFGSIANSFTKEKEPVKTPVVRNVGDMKKQTLSSASQKSSFSWFSSPNKESESVDSILKKNMTEEQRIIYEQTDKDLDDISAILGDLKNMGHAMNRELDTQAKNLEILTTSVDNTNEKLKKSNLKIVKLL